MNNNSAIENQGSYSKKTAITAKLNSSNRDNDKLVITNSTTVVEIPAVIFNENEILRLFQILSDDENFIKENTECMTL